MELIPSLGQVEEALWQALLAREPLQFVGLNDGQKLYLLVRLLTRWRHEQAGRRLILVHSDSKQLAAWDDLLQANLSEVLPALEVGVQQFYGAQRYLHQVLQRSQRLGALSALALGQMDEPLQLITFSSLWQKAVPAKVFRAASFELKQGAEHDQDELIEALRSRGYRQVDEVEEVGQFAIRGSRLDLYSPAYRQPARLEFFADSIEKIKLFSVDTQISTGERASLWVSPPWEQNFPPEERRADAQRLYDALLDSAINPADRQGVVDAFAEGHAIQEAAMLLPALRREESTLFDYIPDEDRFLFLEPLDVCLAKYEASEERWQSDYEDDRSQRKLSLPPEAHYLPSKLARKKLKSLAAVSFGLGEADFAGAQQVQLQSGGTPGGWPQVQDKSALNQWLQYFEAGGFAHDVLILVKQEEHLLRLRSVLQHHDLSFTQTTAKLDRSVQTGTGGRLILGIGSLPQLVWAEWQGVLILPEHILFGEAFNPASSRKKAPKNAFRSFQDITVGSLVVHSDHGVGRYLGMKTMDMGGVRTDFLMLEYADQDRVYLPVYRLSLLQKFSAGEGAADAPLDKLRSQAWAKRKSRAKKAAKDLAEELLRLHAQRRLSQRRAYGAPGDLYFQFEADFVYSETDDQQKAIDEVNADLSGELPMDRLICGDVGFGKTEVALRAAMRVALEGQQVMVLAPTTLLSYQHFETFRNRFRNYGVEVGVANRFVKADKVKTTLEGFSEGKVDVLVGTHRLLSADVKPKNLGLLIVDEEQRFGVAHKERLKKFKAACDILTLTATPIPRSLHMSLIGIRDISVIATPPSERLSIRTYIAQFDPDLIQKAIRQEVARGGQVFFVHNRVQDILEMSGYLRGLMPEVTFAVAHGQMKEDSVEKIIVDFIQQKFSVLVCTTIIESGIDMPNVNTIIVNDADRFGLSQLYQMRGRVGRSTRQSYAYFFTKSPLATNEEARRRLEILATHQELGMGFQIASYDMEMRGSGNILGGEQSGHVNEVGYELYLEMLEKEMAELRGTVAEPDIDPEIKIPISAALGETYIPQERQRLLLYKSLFSASELDEIGRLRSECVDRFGDLPEGAYNLFQVATLKLLLRKLRVAQIQQLQPGQYELRFGQLSPELIRTLTEAAGRRSSPLTLTPDFRLTVREAPSGKALSGLIESLMALTLA